MSSVRTAKGKYGRPQDFHTCPELQALREDLVAMHLFDVLKVKTDKRIDNIRGFIAKISKKIGYELKVIYHPDIIFILRMA